MKFEELKEEEMYAFVAADGAIQVPSLAPDFQTSLGFMELLASRGISKPVAELFNLGWEILPVKVTIIQNGTAQEGFARAKKKLGGTGRV
jgi:hypothetical protein